MSNSRWAPEDIRGTEGNEHARMELHRANEAVAGRGDILAMRQQLETALDGLSQAVGRELALVRECAEKDAQIARLRASLSSFCQHDYACDWYSKTAEWIHALDEGRAALSGTPGDWLAGKIAEATAKPLALLRESGIGKNSPDLDGERFLQSQLACCQRYADSIIEERNEIKDQLAAVTEERDEARRNFEALKHYGGLNNLQPEALQARDASMKREGAAEELERQLREGNIVYLSQQEVQERIAELRGGAQ